MMLSTIFILVAALLNVVVAETSSFFSTGEPITAVSTAVINSLTPYTWYASAAYCPSSETLKWNCGVNCNSNPDFRPVASGGNGDSIQYWYVGYDPSLDTVIVAHQGTNRTEILSLLTDAEVLKKNLNAVLFPGIKSNIECHSGFADEQAKTAADTLSAVETTISKYGTTKVTLVGHSLGAALALLDSIYLPFHLPSSTTFKTIVYGLPRVGNQAFADYVDANVNLIHINHKKDPIPTIPGMLMGFVHPAGEIHIEDSGEWANCPGQDNPSTQCIVGDVRNIYDGKLGDHDGPYNGVTIYC